MRTDIDRLCFALLFSVAVLLIGESASAFELFRSQNGDVADGNEYLAQKKHADALESYDEAARSLPDRNEVHLNRGLALMRIADDKLDQAMQVLKLASEAGSEDPVRARAFSNLGNAFFRKEDYEAAVENYKRSLLLSPGNRDVAWNLEVAGQKQKEKEEQEKKDREKKDQEKEEQDQEDQKDQQDQQDQQDSEDKKDQKDSEDKKDQKDKQDQKDQKDKQDRKDQKDKQDQQKQQQQPKTRQEVEQLLDTLDENQENLIKNQARQRGAMVPVGKMKDW